MKSNERNYMNKDAIDELRKIDNLYSKESI